TATNLGIINQELGNLAAARLYLSQVIDRAPNRKLGQAYFQLARIYARTGEVVLSDQAFQAASNHSPFDVDPISRHYLFSEWSDAFLIDRQEQAKVADSLLTLALDLADQLGEESDYARAFNLNRLGLAKVYQGNADLAIPLLEESLMINRECCEDQDLETSQLTNLGIAHRRMGARDEALDALLASHRINLDLSEGLPDPYLANDFDNLSTYYLQSNPDSASLYARLAVQALLPHLGAVDDFRLPQVGDFEQTSETIALLTYISDWAKAEKVLADNQEAGYENCLDIYRVGDELIRYLFESHEQVQTQLLWRAEARRLYAEALVAAIDAGQNDLAFYFSEQARAQLLLSEQLKARAGAALPSAAYMQLQRATAAATWTMQSTAEAQEILDASDRLKRLQDSLESAFPAYQSAQKIGLPDSPVDLDRVPKDWTVVEYFLEPYLGGWAFVIEDGELRIVSLETERLSDLTHHFRQELTDYESAFDPEPAYQLAQLIWSPLDLVPTDKLVVIPDGVLNDIPFEALLVESAKPEDNLVYRSFPWWGGRYSAAYAYSLRWLLSQESGKVIRERLFFGPMSQIDSDLGLEPNLELSLTATLADQLQAHFDWEILLASEASRPALESRLASVGLLQLSSHAFPSSLQRGGASFLLADAAAPHFYDYELLRHRLHADLVVLAGCDTGQGLDLPGEGVASLGRSFAYAGARSLVTSRWPIDEAATIKILDPFYGSLSEDMLKQDALSAARRQYIKEQLNNELAHPYFWSGLAYIGAPEALPQDKASHFWLFFLAPLLLFLMGLKIFRKPK
ncbi:MAG: CHAT domain-containing tetratricopeptide repeat protein, partial [Bacteroidota bacterium]